MAKVFKDANVFMSRNLVPPEHFDALHDALKLNGAQVFLCCDPSRNGANDFHVIASSDHEKFEILRAKGCNLIGPQCVLSCAKEKRTLPKQGFTCCLAMDGVNVLASGFEKDEKADIAKMVSAMGGTLHIKASSDLSFVIVKNVLAQKYKWALNNLKKPIVTMDWLHQCWKEHRVAPQESYRVPPFSGLTICVSGIPADERKEMEELVIKNKGKYSPELTKKCTHLVCDAPEGDKYKVAKRWGHINIVTRKWFHQSVARRACLSEGSYPVQGSSTSSLSTLKTAEQRSYCKGVRDSQHTSSSIATALDSETIFSAQDMELDIDTLRNMNSTHNEAPAPSLSTDGNCLDDRNKVDSDFAQHVADDSQSENDDLYLSECRISLVGFEAAELRKLVDMVRQGGGSRYMSLNDRLTHIIVGTPSEIEVKEVRSFAAYGIIHVVKMSWLVECNLKKKEVPVLQSHIAYDLLLPKDPVLFNKTITTGKRNTEHRSASHPVADNLQNKISRSAVSSDMKEEAKLEVQSAVSNEARHIKSSTVFKEKLFCFSSSFPEEQRPEIVLWVNEGGGKIVADQNEKGVHFIVERHGAAPCLTKTVRSKYVSTHWIYSCLEDGCLLDINSHILYSPLPCQIPLPGFEGYRLCVSRYDMKERKLLRNLCYVLGVKFVEKLTNKVTHLLCKFADGDKYQAACRWGMHVVTAEWLYECVMQNKVVDLKGYHPKEPTSEDREGGLCSVSQYPSQSIRVSSANDASEHSSHVQETRIAQNTSSSGTSAREMDSNPSGNIKRLRLLQNGFKKRRLSSDPVIDKSAVGTICKDNNVSKNIKGPSSTAPDVAAAIEDLLEQTSKIQDCKSQETIGCRVDPTPDPNPSNHWKNRSEKTNDNSSVEAARPSGPSYDGFSETQTDSQVVGYEEDLSGRQMILDRVRTRSSLA